MRGLDSLRFFCVVEYRHKKINSYRDLPQIRQLKTGCGEIFFIPAYLITADRKAPPQEEAELKKTFLGADSERNILSVTGRIAEINHVSVNGALNFALPCWEQINFFAEKEIGDFSA